MPRPYNTTDLDPESTFERHVFHRDVFAHFLRWTHVLREARIGDSVVDFGCGRGNLLEVLYRNRFRPSRYVGFDIREQTIANAREKFAGITKFRVEFHAVDLVQTPVAAFEQLNADKVCSFEVLEHVGKQNAAAFLDRFMACGSPDATYYLSTPNYDAHVGAADNHTYDSGDGRGRVPQEFEFDETLAAVLAAGFEVQRVFGTFASQRDYVQAMTAEQAVVYEQLKEYYDSNLVSNIMAAIMPARLARNALWVMKRA